MHERMMDKSIQPSNEEMVDLIGQTVAEERTAVRHRQIQASRWLSPLLFREVKAEKLFLKTYVFSLLLL